VQLSFSFSYESSSDSEKFEPTQIKGTNDELDRALFAALKKFAKEKGLNGYKGRPSTLMQKSAIYKAGYAQGSGKAAKATAKKTEKRAVETRKIIIGRVQKEKELPFGASEGPHRLALLQRLSPAAYTHVVAKAKSFQTVPIPGAPQCRAVVRSTAHVGHQRRRHHVAIDQDIDVHASAGGRSFMTHVVIAFDRASGQAIGDNGGQRPVEAGDETSHLCHHNDCVACAVIESGRRNTMRNPCKARGECSCGLDPPCRFV